MLMSTGNITLEGLSDLLFDKFWDHDKMDRPIDQKMYLNDDNHLVMPGSNLHAFLWNERKAGCVKFFEGKGSPQYLARVGFVNIVDREALILGKGDKPIKWTGQAKKPIFIINESGVTGSGNKIVKQPIKPRPGVSLPWKIQFSITVVENDMIDVQKLYNWVSRGGLLIGLGTWRPRFGRFLVAKWDVSESGKSEPLISIMREEMEADPD